MVEARSSFEHHWSGRSNALHGSPTVWGVVNVDPVQQAHLVVATVAPKLHLAGRSEHAEVVQRSSYEHHPSRRGCALHAPPQGGVGPAVRGFVDVDPVQQAYLDGVPR